MAKFNGGIFSKVKGKLAGVVFQQYEGMQVGKEYQPNVKNPSTENQVINRAKFKGASQMVALFGSIFVIALANVSPYVRTLRGMAVKALRRAFTWVEVDKAASIEIAEAAAAINAIANNVVVPAPILAGTSISNATLAADEGDTVFYRIAALDEDGVTIGVSETTFTMASDPVAIVAPRTAGTPDKYTIAAVATRNVAGMGDPNYSNLINANLIEVYRRVNAGDVISSPVTMGSVNA